MWLRSAGDGLRTRDFHVSQPISPHETNPMSVALYPGFPRATGEEVASALLRHPREMGVEIRKAKAVGQGQVAALNAVKYLAVLDAQKVEMKQ